MKRSIFCLASYPVGLAVLVLALPGCDPNAKANSNDRTLFAADRLSKAYESCAATSDCVEGTRCLENLCQATSNSVIGDYQAAVGARELAEGNINAAIEAYTAAVNRYKSDNVPVPASLQCALGRALASAASEPQMAEGAARALDQCLRESPVGSRLHDQALAQLAILGRAGLDPEHLGSKEPPARYMTKQAALPTGKIVAKATGDAQKRVKSYDDFLALIETEASAARLMPCWEMNWKATKKKSLAVTVPFKNQFLQGEYEEDDRYKITATGTAPIDGSAQKCVYDVLVALAEEQSKTSRSGQSWAAKITVTLEQ